MRGFLLVFDLDGTLVDSVMDLRAALNEVLRERGHRALSRAEVKHMIGDGVPTLVARALAASGADPADASLPRRGRDTHNTAPARVSHCDLHQQTATSNARRDAGSRPPPVVR